MGRYLIKSYYNIIYKMYNFQQKLTLKLCKYKCVLCMTIIAQRKESKGRYIGENFLSTVEIGLILN